MGSARQQGYTAETPDWDVGWRLAAGRGRGNAHVCLENIASGRVLAVCDVLHRPRLHIRPPVSLLPAFLTPAGAASRAAGVSGRFTLNLPRASPSSSSLASAQLPPFRAVPVFPTIPLMSPYELDVPSIPSPRLPHPVSDSRRRPDHHNHLPRPIRTSG